MTMLESALKQLGKFTVDSTDIGLDLTKSVTWKAAKTAWDKLQLLYQPIHQSAATEADIIKAVNLSKDPEIQAFLVLMWLFSGRKGDISRLKVGTLTLNEKTNRLQVPISEGKGVHARKGLYHLVSEAPSPQWKQIILALINKRKEAGQVYLFRPSLQTSSEINVALRAANLELSCRSVRRGALQAMSAAGVDSTILMQHSGHKRVETLHRYLDWNRVNEAAHKEAQKAARALSQEQLKEMKKEKASAQQQQQQQEQPQL